MSNKLAEQLADKAVQAVIKAGVREDILDTLLHAVQVNVRDAVMEALLVMVGNSIIERDKEWLRELKGIWSPKAGLRDATTPAEVEREIRAWHAAHVAEVRTTAYQSGYTDAFPTALEEGARLGWASREAEKGLEDVLKHCKSIKPH